MIRSSGTVVVRGTLANPDVTFWEWFGMLKAVVEDQARALTNPPTTTDELLDRLRTVGLPRAVAAIQHELGT